jgi:site-specific recombinase XerD
MKTSNKGVKFPVETLSETEVIALLKACTKGACGIRNQALLTLLYRGGLRNSECLVLLPKDLDRSRGTLRVLHGKGDKARIVGLDPGAWLVLQHWLDRRASLGIGDRKPVFCTLTGEPVKTAYVRGLLKRLGRKANIAKRCHPHALRHTHASELRQEGVDIGVISKQLGHSSIAITVRYLDHICPQLVVDAMKSRRWAFSG